MNETPEQTAIRLLRTRGLTLATAESCTGGLTAKRLTDIPGASAVFMGGVVSYTNGVKERVLGVPRDLLDTCGAVSEPVARAMAEGVRKALQTDVALSVTGVAGPDRDERGNAVGTVFAALATAAETKTLSLHLQGDRAAIRQQSADEMLRLLVQYLQL